MFLNVSRESDKVPMRFLQNGLGAFHISLFGLMIQKYISEGTADNALWLCHFSNLILGLALLLPLNKLAWIASFWLHIGTILWIWEMIALKELTHWRSFVAHLGGSGGALLVAKIIPIPFPDRYITVDAGLYALLVQFLSR